MDVAPSPSLLLFVRNTDINVLRSFSLREKSLSIPVSRANGSVFNPGSKGIFQDFCVQPNTRTNISTNIFRSAMIHGSGTSDVDLGASQKLLFFPSISSCGRETKAIRRCREIGSRKRRRNCLLLLVDWLFPTFSFGVERKSSRFFLPLFFPFSLPLLLFVRSFLGNTRNLVLIEFKQGSGRPRRWQSRSVQQNFNERTLPIGSRGNLKASEKGRGELGSIFVERG